MDNQPVVSRELEDGTRIELWQYLFNHRIMHVADGLTHPEIITQFCIRNPVKAMLAAATWNGEGRPAGWFKDLQTMEYNPEERP